MSGNFQIAEGVAGGYFPRGAAADLWRCKARSVMIAGPAETGKTFSALQKIDALAWKYAGAQGLIVRKTYKSAVGSVAITFAKKVLGAINDDGVFDRRRSPVQIYGGARPEFYAYPNGSRISVGGMDNADKHLSAEFDFIYINQAEELRLDDWETLSTRATGRAGNMPYAQMIGDCNPGSDKHWILGLRDAGKLTMLESRHEDNPTLYDDEGNLTEQGKRTMASLDALTGVRLQRLRFGRWASAEGVVYEEFSAAKHLIARFDIPAEWPRYLTIDWGYTNPLACQWWAVDGDGRGYMYREIYQTGLLVEDFARLCKQICSDNGERITDIICDHDAEDRKTFERHFGQRTVAAWKPIALGIQMAQARLRAAGDGKPRLFFLQDSLVRRDSGLAQRRAPTSTIDEFDSYVWPDGQSGRAERETPVDANNHGLDAMRYFVAHLDRRGGAVEARIL